MTQFLMASKFNDTCYPLVWNKRASIVMITTCVYSILSFLHILYNLQVAIVSRAYGLQYMLNTVTRERSHFLEMVEYCMVSSCLQYIFLWLLSFFSSPILVYKHPSNCAAFLNLNYSIHFTHCHYGDAVLNSAETYIVMRNDYVITLIHNPYESYI